MHYDTLIHEFRRIKLSMRECKTTFFSVIAQSRSIFAIFIVSEAIAKYAELPQNLR